MLKLWNELPEDMYISFSEICTLRTNQACEKAQVLQQA